ITMTDTPSSVARASDPAPMGPLTGRWRSMRSRANPHVNSRPPRSGPSAWSPTAVGNVGRGETPPSRGGPAGICRDDRAVDVTGLIRGQEERQVGNILRLQERRNERGVLAGALGSAGVQPFRGHRFGNIGRGAAGADR